MTIEALSLVSRYLGNGVQVEFPVGFPVFGDGRHVKAVIAIGGGSALKESPLVYGVDYTVREVSGGGACVTVAPVPAGSVLALYLELPCRQPRDFDNAGRLDAEEIEKGLDYVTALAAQSVAAFARAIKVPISGDQTPEELLADIFDARDQAATSRDEAQASAAQAANSADDAARDATRAELARDAAEAARADAEAIAQGVHVEVSEAGDVQIARVEAAGDEQARRITGEGSVWEQRLADLESARAQLTGDMAGKLDTSAALGVGQTHQSVSRLSNVRYTNNTGRPIVVYIRYAWAGSGEANIHFFVDDNQVQEIFLDDPRGATGGCLTAVVPDGSIYYWLNVARAPNPSIYELR